MKRSTGYILTSFRVALGLALLYYVLSATRGWAAVEPLLSEVWVLLAVSMVPLFGAACEALRLRLLLRSQNVHISFSFGYQLVAVATLFNLVIPSGTGGDVMKIYYLNARNRGTVVEAAAVLLVDRAIALFSLLGFILVLAMRNIQLVQNSALLGGLVAASGATMLVLLVAAVLSCSTRVRTSRWYPFVVQRVPFHRYLQRFADALYAFRSRKVDLVGAFMISVAGHLLLAAMFVVIGAIAIPESTGSQAAFLSMLGLIANVLPVTPGGLGVGEGAAEILFAAAGMSGGAVMIVVWRLSAAPLCIVGAFFYLAGISPEEKRSIPPDYCPSEPGHAALHD